MNLFASRFRQPSRRRPFRPVACASPLLYPLLAGLAALSAPSGASAQPSDVWRPGALSATTKHASAFDSTRGVLVAYRFGETWEFDGSAWLLRATASAGPGTRTWPAMTFDANRGVCVLFGGDDGPPLASQDDTWEWNGVVWTERCDVSGPPGRREQAMAFDATRGVVVMFGGYSRAIGDELGDLWEYDGVTWVERVAASAPSARARSAIAWLGGMQQIAITGGFNGLARSGLYFWDGANWTTGQTGATSRYEHAMAYDATRDVLVMHGGSTSGWPTGDRDTWEFDGVNWSRISISGPRARAHTMAYDAAAGRLLMLGGENSASGPFGDVETWDGATWSDVAPVPTRRSAVAMCYDSTRQACVMYGGDVGDGNQYAQETWVCDATGWSRLTTTGATPPRSYQPAMAYDAGHDVVLMQCGVENGVSPAMTYQLSGNTWSLVSSSTNRAKVGCAMAYDGARGRVVMFGGAYDRFDVDTIRGATLEWLPGWSTVATTGPTKRMYSAMAYDEARQVTVLFGGWALINQSLVALNDTWEWNGATWTQITASGPSARYGHGMCYDPVGGGVLLFGGSAPRYSNDIWRFDGAAWTLISDGAGIGGSSGIPGPGGRRQFGLAYDASRSAMVLFGGTSGGFANDTWLWGVFDADGDGVGDDWDLCAASPVGVEVDARGCVVPPAGDLNGDLAVDATDAGLLVDALLSGGAGSSCGGDSADVNADGLVDGDDVPVFVGILLSP